MLRQPLAEELARHTIIGGGGGALWRHYHAWLQQLGLDLQITLQQGSSTGLLSSARSGLGIAVLPCIVADAEPDLVRCLEPRGDHGRTLWLLTHERVRRNPAVRSVIDFLYARLSKHIRQLEAARTLPEAHAS